MRSPISLVSFVVAVAGVMVASIAPAWAPVTPSLPEPTSAVVFGAGLVGVALFGLRKRK